MEQASHHQAGGDLNCGATVEGVTSYLVLKIFTIRQAPPLWLPTGTSPWLERGLRMRGIPTGRCLLDAFSQAMMTSGRGWQQLTELLQPSASNIHTAAVTSRARGAEGLDNGVVITLVVWSG